MRNKIEGVLFVALLMAILGQTGCKRHESSSSEQTSKTSESSSQTDEEEEAITTVKTMIQREGMTAKLSEPYTISHTDSETCSPQEVEAEQDANPNNPELWPCKSPSNSPPFTRKVTTTNQICCHVITVPVVVSDLTDWSAEPETDGDWMVRAKYFVVGQNHVSSWRVSLEKKNIGPQTDQ